MGNQHLTACEGRGLAPDPVWAIVIINGLGPVWGGEVSRAGSFARCVRVRYGVGRLGMDVGLGDAVW